MVYVMSFTYVEAYQLYIDLYLTIMYLLVLMLISHYCVIPVFFYAFLVENVV